MLHLIPPRLHRALYRVAHAVRRQWWRIRRPRRSSVLVVAFDDAGKVLLVRHSYGHPLWLLPGGGVNRGEPPERAAAREMREELGCDLAEMIAIDVCENRTTGASDLLHVFGARLVGEPVPDMREIVAVALADPDDLPEPSGSGTRERIAQAVAFRRERSEQR